MSPTSYQTAPPRDISSGEAAAIIAAGLLCVKGPAQLSEVRFYFRVVTVARMAVRRSGGMSSISTAVAYFAARMVSR